MDFSFTEDQDLLLAGAEARLADLCAMPKLRRFEGFDAPRWRGLCALGLAGLLVSEDAGGLGLAGPDFVRIATACGAHLLPEPMVEMAGTVLPALEAAGEGALVAELLARGAYVAVVRQGVAAFPEAAQLLLVETAAGWTLVAPERCGLTPQAHVDPLLRLARVTAPTGAGRPVAALDGAGLLDRGALWSAAQLLGLAQKSIDLAVAYAKERQQFGRPIGSYQAIKHHLATAQVKIEFARPVLHAAATLAPGSGDFAAARISHALLAAGEAADLATRTALQVHGAMGISWEVDVHFALKRCLWLRWFWEGEFYHRARVARRALQERIGTDGLFAP